MNRRPESAEAAEIQSLRDTLERVSSQLTALVQRQPSQRLLSKREAARLLGVSRGATLNRLIQEGALRTIVVGKRAKIPMAEIEQLIAKGAPFPPEPAAPPVTTAAPRPARPHRPRPVGSTVAAIRALPI